MRCECGSQMVATEATSDSPYLYTLSGLKNVFLCNIMIRRCLHCKIESPIIPAIGELHEVIAECLLRQPISLSASEIRFLRKHAGLKAKELAKRIGVTASTLSRLENGKMPITPSADKLVRATVAAEKNAARAQEILRREALLKDARTRIHARLNIERIRDRWTAAANC